MTAIVITREQLQRLRWAYDGLVSEGVALAPTADTDGMEHYADEIGEVINAIEAANQ